MSAEEADELTLRHAKPKDVPRLEELIATSVRGLSVGYYTAQQIESAIRYMFGVDSQLIKDRTYYLIESSTGPVACGGWSKRETLFGGDRHKSGADPLLDPHVSPARIRAFFVHPDRAKQGLGRRLYVACRNAAEAAGFRHLELAATLPGEPMYARLGFERLERIDVRLPDGIVLPVVRMSRAIG